MSVQWSEPEQVCIFPIGPRRSPPCPVCGSERTETDRIPVPSSSDIVPSDWPTIAGASRCLDCEDRITEQGMVAVEVPTFGQLFVRYVAEEPR